MRHATALVEKYEREASGARKREEVLQISLTEETMAHQSTKKKVDFLELENAELRNNLQATTAQNDDMKRFLAKIKELLDFFSIEKRTRNGKRKPAATAAAQTLSETKPEEEVVCAAPLPPSP
jgi:hypothetical protein